MDAMKVKMTVNYDAKHANPLAYSFNNSDDNLNHSLAPMSSFISSVDNKMINFVFSLPLVIVVQ